MRFLEFAARREKALMREHYALDRKRTAGRQFVLASIFQPSFHGIVMSFV
jgi:hypothetical protein